GRRPGYFSFLDPFSPGVWLFMLLAYLAVSCVLFLVARLTPYEWYNPHPCLKGRCNLLINQYSLGNSFWFPVGGFMQQGSTIAPRALSTRPGEILTDAEYGGLQPLSTWYERSMCGAAFMVTSEERFWQYSNCRRSSNSRYQTYQRMWNFMNSKQPSVFVKSTEEGIARVLNSNYAYLLESTMNEYYRQRNCNLTQIGGLLDTKGYGIGMPLGSVYRDEFDLAILKLQEDNRLEILKRKWWDGGKCPKEEDHRAKGLIFILRPILNQSVCEEMLRELHGIVLCQDSLQVRRRRAASILRPRPLPLEERRARAAAVSLSNGKLCAGTGLPEPLSHRLAQEAALVARGCSHIRICPECRRFQGLRMRPAGAGGALPSPTHSEESIEWDKTTNSSEPE
ncbi:Glutamate receptor ionotropic, kainate 4, partial [Xenoophorus captivus]